jgi:predicted nucleic acid-binding protein
VKWISARSIAALAIATSLASALPLTAFATTPTSTSTSTSSTVAVSPLRAYKIALKAYNAKLQAIDSSFVAAVKVAKTTFNLAIATATNSSQRITARSLLRVAIANAIVTRDAAFTRLGKAPTNPVKTHKGHEGLKFSHQI